MQQVSLEGTELLEILMAETALLEAGTERKETEGGKFVSLETWTSKFSRFI